MECRPGQFLHLAQSPALIVSEQSACQNISAATSLKLLIRVLMLAFGRLELQRKLDVNFDFNSYV